MVQLCSLLCRGNTICVLPEDFLFFSGGHTFRRKSQKVNSLHFVNLNASTLPFNDKETTDDLGQLGETVSNKTIL